MKNNKLNSKYITGFIDGEGCFTLSIYKDNKYKLGWNVIPSFQVESHTRDLDLLKKVQDYFGLGRIKILKENGRNSAMFIVTKIKDLNDVIIPHFIKYPLLTQKQADYELFKLVVDIINNKEHLSEQGLIKLISIKASMNLGLSQTLIKAFPDVLKINRPLIK